ncbi:MAG: hypothetical protein DI535_00740 [Citrobacter freundii]|nr:MAG: hypothetical protein DI535_00740 [Citrobacter freundii]
MKKIALVLALGFLFCHVHAQSLPAECDKAMKTDDLASFAKMVPAASVNSCYKVGEWDYSLLSLVIKANAQKCFAYLVEKGANVNISCNGYVPPLMHAVKYGKLDMVKMLVSKGADINYTYTGDYTPADGKSVIAYAEANNQPEILAFLKEALK